MKNETYVENDVCEACGCAGEMGYVIKEGDDVAEVTITGKDKAALEQEFERYLSLAKQVNPAVQFEKSPVNDDATELTANFTFEVSAEKLIFELKSRSLAR
ncbi:YfcZ/YiiS family protein [Vibrio salinus]|uniref:YfcZ/YiiS family protein n=1 Tax=Vibrio salinus TaxID=2899784 RepID=UPI001E55CE29|nr:YfcZ/YiiS family protein [Vibrio salinus]MCE0495334.1 YfcZ/YiiS family protein [Vibrio salinus]